jgi:hypothetical protein
VSSVIDWKWANRDPIPVGLQCPRILALPRPDDTHSTVNHESTAITVPPSPSVRLLADREIVASYLKTRVPFERSGGPAEQLLSSLTDPNMDWKDLIIQACFSKGLASWLAARAWLVTEMPSDEALGKEAEEYLKTKEAVTGATKDGLLMRQDFLTFVKFN